MEYRDINLAIIDAISPKEVDDLLELKADKDEVETVLDTKADKEITYTKEEVDNIIASKFQVVDELPENPDPTVFYFIREKQSY